MRVELLARGFDYLSTTRANQFISDASSELDEMRTWPYRESTATGSTPLLVSDLGEVDTVFDTGQVRELQPMTRADLIDAYGDLSAVSGGSFAYYITSGNTINSYPLGATVRVQYWAITPTLTSDAQTPLSPARWHQIIVHMAVRRAYLDSDNFDAAQGVQIEIDRLVAIMDDSLLGQEQIRYAQAVGEDGGW